MQSIHAKYMRVWNNAVAKYRGKCETGAMQKQKWGHTLRVVREKKRQDKNGVELVLLSRWSVIHENFVPTPADLSGDRSTTVVQGKGPAVIVVCEPLRRALQRNGARACSAPRAGPLGSR